MRHGSRRAVSLSLGIPDDWATVRQVHGATVRVVDAPGPAGDADALVTTAQAVPLAVFTADCLGIVIEGDSGVAVAHGGWRGLRAGVIDHVLVALRGAGVEPQRAAIGPAIGPCCFEVGEDVLTEFAPSLHSKTTWDTPSVDLVGFAESRLGGVDVWRADVCTRCGDGAFSHRRDRTPQRMATLAWLS